MLPNFLAMEPFFCRTSLGINVLWSIFGSAIQAVTYCENLRCCDNPSEGRHILHRRRDVDMLGLVQKKWFRWVRPLRIILYRNAWWRQNIYHGEEKRRIGFIWGNMGAVISYLEDRGVEEGKELVFVDTQTETRPLGRSHRKTCFHSI